MGLAIFAIFLVTMIVLFLLIALGRISFGPSMIILGIVILIFLLIISLLGGLGRFLKVAAVLLAIAILFAVIAYYGASGLTSLFWWLGKDTTPAEKEKTKTCPACRAENMLGKTFCIKCGGRLGHFESEKKSNELSKKVSAHRKIAVRKRKTKFCPKCGAENMFGRIFCAKCRKQLIFPTDVIRGLKISRKAATDKKRSKKLP